MRKRKQNSTDEAEVNMTPMLDIVFIMLIFFIVASTFTREDGLDVTQDQDSQQLEKPDNQQTPLFIQICRNGDVMIDKRLIDARAVRANVERQTAKRPEAQVIVETGQGAPTGVLVRVLDQVRAAQAKLSLSPHNRGCQPHRNRATAAL